MMEYSQNTGWTEDGTPAAMTQSDRDEMDQAMMARFEKFSPYDMAMFGGWTTEQTEAAS